MAGICSNEGGDQSSDSHIVQVTIRPIFLQPQCVSLTVGSIHPLITLLDSWMHINLKIRRWYEEVGHHTVAKTGSVSESWQVGVGVVAVPGLAMHNTAEVAMYAVYTACMGIETARDTCWQHVNFLPVFRNPPIKIYIDKQVSQLMVLHLLFMISLSVNQALKTDSHYFIQEDKLLTKFPTTFSST